MKPSLPLFIMVDACGWEIIRSDPFAQAVAPYRRKLRSVLGYSCACIPSILSGACPEEHRHWAYFVYDPVRSPFGGLKWCRWLPRCLTGRRRVRRLLTRWAKRRLGFTGYFDLYNIPFEHIHLFDYTEKKSPLRPNGMNRGANIFDRLEAESIPYFGSDPSSSERDNTASLIEQIESERIDFGFMYWPGLDGLLHRVGNDSPEIPARLRWYEGEIERLLEAAREHYAQVRLFIFSDHGMANCEEFLDLKSALAEPGLRMGRDYAAVYDSTMARFWFFSDRARTRIVARLGQIPQGRIVPEDELRELGTYFADHYFGELVFLVKEGVLIVPSDMGERPLRAMHGYHPDEKQSYAALLTSQADIPEQVAALTDLFGLMWREARLAHQDNAATELDVEAARPEDIYEMG